MNTTIEKKNISEEKQVIYDAIKTSMGTVLHELESSEILSDLGINTNSEVVNLVHKLVDKLEESPFEVYSDLIDSINLPIIEALHLEVLEEFQENKKYISEVFRTAPNALHYCIVLKKDTLNIRGHFFDFLITYGETKGSHRFPITFEFIPSQLATSLKGVTKIEL